LDWNGDQRTHQYLDKEEEAELIIAARIPSRMLYYCVCCADQTLNIGEHHSCKIECPDCCARLLNIGESHNCPQPYLDYYENEGFEDQREFVYDKLKDLALRILTGEEVTLLRFYNSQYWSVPIPQYIQDDLNK